MYNIYLAILYTMNRQTICLLFVELEVREVRKMAMRTRKDGEGLKLMIPGRNH